MRGESWDETCQCHNFLEQFCGWSSHPNNSVVAGGSERELGGDWRCSVSFAACFLGCSPLVRRRRRPDRLVPHFPSRELASTFVSTAIYYVAASLPAFFAGKFFEGLRDASYWAVNRTAIFHLSPRREGREATRNNAIIWLATAVGSAVAGLGIAYTGFSWTIVILMFASAGIGLPAALLWKIGRRTSNPEKKNLLKLLDPRRKGSASGGLP